MNKVEGESEENLLVDGKIRSKKQNKDKDNRSQIVGSQQNLLLVSSSKMSYRLTRMRWLGLFLACMSMFGSYYCFDNPQALQIGLQDRMGLSDLQYNSLYSIYSFPNIVLPLVGGLVIDKVGVRVGTFVFSFILIIGQLIFMTGGIYESFWVMMVGRFVFGLGGECLCVSQSVIISQWFKDKELALALGLNITIARIGSSVNSALTPVIYQAQLDNHSNSPFFLPTFIGVLICIISWLCGCIMNYMDKESDRREGLMIKSVDERRRSGVIEESEQVKFRDIFSFNSMFWILVVNCALIYGGFFSFNSNANDILVRLYGVDKSVAGVYLLCIYLSASLVTPLFGGIIDKYGKRVMMMMGSIVLFVVAMIGFCMIPENANKLLPLIPLVMVGVFYATYAAIFWPCIPMVVDSSKVGTAFGVVNSIQNVNLVISPLLFGFIKNATDQIKHGYLWAFIFIIAQNIIALIFTIILYFQDIKGLQVLHKVSKPTKLSRLTKSSILRR